jgi:hypothetical protein
MIRKTISICSNFVDTKNMYKYLELKKISFKFILNISISIISTIDSVIETTIINKKKIIDENSIRDFVTNVNIKTEKIETINV